MPALVSSVRGIDPIRNCLRLRQFLGRRPVASERPHFVIDGLDRALDIAGIDAGAHDQRAHADARIERAEGVVRHALTLADVVREAATKPELPEDIVHHEIGVIARIEPPDRGEAVGDVRLGLPGQIDHALRRARRPAAAARLPARRRRDRTSRRARTRRGPARVQGATCPTIASDSAAGRKRSAWNRASSAHVMLSTLSTVPLARRPYGCEAP